MMKTFARVFLLLSLTPLILSGQPKFNLVGGTTFDFGVLYHGKAHKTLIIKNDGTDTLVISNVSSSCGCTGTLMSNEHIAPGDSGALAITFDTQKAHGDSKKAVSMETNDPKMPKARISFTANVIPLLDILPDYVYFQGKEGSPITQELTLKNPGTSTISILSVIPSIDNITTKVQESKLGAGQETKLVCVFTPKSKGMMKASLMIKTDNPNLPEVELRVVGLVTGSVSGSENKSN